MKTLYCFLLLAFTLFISPLAAQIPYEYDKEFDHLAPEDLCAFRAKHPNVKWLDVRSQGEYMDTSMFITLNRGRIKGAMNLDIDVLDSLKHTLNAYKNDTIVTYCSHSQRSRRAAHILKAAGFAHVINLDGGITWIGTHLAENPCLSDWVEYRIPYHLHGAKSFCDGFRSKNSMLLDLRTDAEFNAADSIPLKNYGHWKNSVHVLPENLTSWVAAHPEMKSKAIYLFDADGYNASHAAMKLDSLGCKNVNVMLGGSYELFLSDDWPKLKKYFDYVPHFEIVNAAGALKLLQNKKPLILDARSSAEYHSQSKMSWQNVGIIRGALCAEKTNLDSLFRSSSPQKTTVLVYGMQQKSDLMARLEKAGCKKVYYLHGGIWGMLSREANTRNFGSRKYLTWYDKRNE